MKMYKIEIFIPEEYVESLLCAMNDAGACRLGNYDHCMTMIPIQGFWRPLAGANPFLGEVGKINSGREMKVETICESKFLEATISAIRKIHPYEVPLINVIALDNAAYRKIEI